MHSCDVTRMLVDVRIEDLHRRARAERLVATCRGGGWPTRLVAWLRRRPLSLDREPAPAAAATVSVRATPPVGAAASVVDLRDTGVQTTVGLTEPLRTPGDGGVWFVGALTVTGPVRARVPADQLHAVTGAGRAACTAQTLPYTFLSRAWSGVAPTDRCPRCVDAVRALAKLPRQGSYEVPALRPS